MQIKNVKPGDEVTIQTREKTWQGNVIESYDAEIMLLKLSSGYNIGIRQSEIKEVTITKKAQKPKEQKLKFTSEKELRNVALVVVGGTISSRLDPKSGAVTWTTIDDIIKIAPEITNICNITEVKSPFMKGSADMSLKDWKVVASTVHELLEREDIDGVIVTQGTDSLPYTASALSFFIQNLNKPVAFTYSQRSIDRASTDAHLNMLCAAQYAVSDIAEVAVIGHKNLSDTECYALPATKCRKMHTSRRDAFQVINDTPIATIVKDGLTINRSFNARGDQKPRLDTKYSDKVALIKVFPGQSPSIIEHYMNEGYKGLILEASGLGHLPGKESVHNWIPTIKKAIKNGMIICAAPTTLYGALNPKVYAYGREMEKSGIIYLKDMLPETAYIKLSWVLGHKSWVYNDKSVPEKMLKNFVGEYNERLSFDDFNSNV